ncbi:MAG: hypothetical protein KDC72_09370, partial [Bacteroidetes bacterium]|nr:hypothetical protein [Bacteroidota bacterium]
MWNRIKNRLSANKSAVNVKELIDNIENVRKRSTILVLYGSPTNGSWLGIANATLGLFPNEAVEIPQWYSHLELNSKQEKEVLNLIAKLKFEKIIVSGFASFFFKWIDYVHASTQVTILFHGTISEFHDENRREFIAQLITYGRQNKINSFGFVKVGLAEIFNTLYGFKTYHQALNAPSIPENLDKL